MKALLALASLALLTACGSGGPPPPDWKTDAADLIERYKKHALLGENSLAERYYQQAIIATGGAGRVADTARLWLVRCATLFEQRPQVIRRVISEQTAAWLTQAFEGVVERGTAKGSRIQGVRIAGKTGTSKKVIDGRYGTNSYTGSFVGFFPVEDPQVVCLVMMDNPQGDQYYGGDVSAPVFRAIADRIINTTGRFTKAPKPTDQAPENGITVPDVRTLQLDIATRMIESHGLRYRTVGSGDIVVRQVPEPGKRLEKDDIVQIVLNEADRASAAGELTVPS